MIWWLLWISLYFLIVGMTWRELAKSIALSKVIIKDDLMK